MKFAVLIGEGPNDVMIPCRIFSNMEKALEKCKELFSKADYKKHSENHRWFFEDEIPENIQEILFKDYYGGCGECYALTLKEVDEDSSFISWNLD